MHRIQFECPLTTLEIREPSVEACEQIATAHEVYAVFMQPQQRTFDRMGDEKTRIGLGTHKDWFIRFQIEHPSTSKSKVLPVAQLVIKSLVDPGQRAYGGFRYPEYSESEELYTYPFIDIEPDPSHWPPIDAAVNSKFCDLSAAAIAETFKGYCPRLL